jgi:hypothetical protein
VSLTSSAAMLWACKCLCGRKQRKASFVTTQNTPKNIFGARVFSTEIVLTTNRYFVGILFFYFPTPS